MREKAENAARLPNGLSAEALAKEELRQTLADFLSMILGKYACLRYRLWLDRFARNSIVVLRKSHRS